MTPVLVRASLRHASRHPWQVLLAGLGVALGVAVVTAVDLTRASARQSFDRATQSVVGTATHQIVGGPEGIDEELYARLRRAGIEGDLAPVVEATVRLPEHGGRVMRVLGVDPIVEAPLRGYWSQAGQTVDVGALMTRPGTALVSRGIAERLGLAKGDRLRVATGGRDARLEVLGVLDGGGRYPALVGTDLAVVDIATAQELLGMVGRLSRVDLAVSPAQAERVQAMLGADAELVPVEARAKAAANLTRAFHTNLMALSLLALLVGVFLVYNSQTFMVLQRREQFGMLRAVGVRRRQLAALVLGEAAALGAIGSLVGLMLGLLLARGLVGMVTRTINDLYYAVSVGAVSLDPASLAKGALLGLGGSMVAALVPAREATRVEPRAALSRAELEGRAGAAVGLALRLGIGLIALGLAVFLVPTRSIAIALVGLFLVVMGAALASPAMTVGLVRTLQRWPGLQANVPARLALRGVTSALSRTGVAVAALMLAVSHTIGVGVMVASFRHSVTDWLSNLLRADYYLSIPESGVQGGPAVLSVDALSAIAAIPGVQKLSHVRRVDIASAHGTNTIAAYQLNDAARRGFRFRANPQPATVWQRFETEDAVLVSESYAYHHNMAPGDRVVLRTDTGERPFQVIAVYQDYSRDRGTVAMSRATYNRHWRDDGLNGVGVYAGPGFDLDTFEQQLFAILGPQRGVEVVASHEILEESLRVFDRTFTITEVLRLLAGIIAFVGVFSALMAIQLERSRELGLLRAVGMSPGQIRRMVLGETAVIGGAAGLIAIPVGLGMALILIYVVNRRSFGWTMGIDLDLGLLVGAFLTALVAALLAGLYPAARMGRVQPADALRIE